ncbi:MAG: DNA repair protein RecN, partial [Eubacteriales bacterium]
IVSRDLSADGKNTCRINGAAVNLATLKEFMDRIVDLHGQHEHQFLLQSKTHIGFVDSFGGSAIEELKAGIRGQYKQYRSLLDDRAAIGGTPQERARNMDLLRFEIEEIQKAVVHPGEEEALREELNAVLNAEKIALALTGCHTALYARQDSLLGELSRITRELDAIASYNSAYATLTERLQESYYSLEDIAQEAQALAEQVLFDQKRVEQIEERLDVLFGLKRKYGGSEEAICSYLDDASEKLDRLENSDRLLTEIQGKLGEVQRKMYTLYTQLSDNRRNIARELEGLIERELKDLGMASSRFQVKFEDLPPFEESAFTDYGLDKIEFMISTNIGEPLKPLSKIVSGGEVSRIMLAFKNVLANTDRISTLIFDEIDTGISGNMAHVVAEKLYCIARSKQVVCVTHLPQIAAIADANYLIDKIQQDGKMITHVESLNDEGKIYEVSRLSGGGNSQNSLLHAAEMIQKAELFKKS